MYQYVPSCTWAFARERGVTFAVGITASGRKAERGIQRVREKERERARVIHFAANPLAVDNGNNGIAIGADKLTDKGKYSVAVSENRSHGITGKTVEIALNPEISP